MDPDRAPDETTELFAQSARGDENAIATLLSRHGEAIRRTVRENMTPLIRREGDTGDVVQEVMLRVLSTHSPIRFAGPEQFRAYVSTVVRNTLRSIAGRHKRGKRDHAREVAHLTEVLSGGGHAAPVRETTGPDARAMRSEDAAWVLAALDLLDGPEQDVLWLRVGDDLDFATVGQRLGLTSDAARMRYQRAVRHLARTLSSIRTGRLDAILSAG